MIIFCDIMMYHHDAKNCETVFCEKQQSETHTKMRNAKLENSDKCNSSIRNSFEVVSLQKAIFPYNS